MRTPLFFVLLLASVPALAQETQAPEGGALGMSIVGNDEAPKALVIVPWKASEPGKAPERPMTPEVAKAPIDKEVFARMLTYYRIRSESQPAADAALRRKQ